MIGDNLSFKLMNSNVAMAKLSDFDRALKGVEKLDAKPQRRLNEAQNNDSWYQDPDRGSLDDRLRGKFQYAEDLMRKMKVDASCGNIVSLMPDIEFGMLDGTEVDFDQYLRHDPRCLGRINMPEAENGERIIRIAVGIGGNCGISPEELVRRAALVLKVVQEYAEAGYGVEAYAFFATSLNCRPGDSRIGIIDCTQAATGQIVSAMASSRVFRSLVFALMDVIPDMTPYIGYPIGFTQNPEHIPDTNEKLKKVLGDNTKIVHAGANENQIREALK
jgi:hypothetical protein